MAEENAPLTGSEGGESAAKPETAPPTAGESAAPKTPTEGDSEAQKAPTGDGKAEAAPEQPPEKKEADEASSRRTQDAIQAAHRRRREAEAKKAAAEAERDRLRERLKLYETPAPDRFDYDSDDAYQAALVQHQVKQANKSEREADAKDAQVQAEAAGRETTAAAQAEFNARANVFRENVPDFAETVYSEALPISEAMQAQLYASEQGPQIAYYLGKNLDVAHQLYGLTNPTDVAREIGRIEGRLTKPAPKTVTSAPPPMEAVATGSGSMGEPSTAEKVRRSLYPDKYKKGAAK